tara:strand:- start:174 stop:851 length:678 start_codon:yes stop_codon:yes gene_type:complete
MKDSLYQKIIEELSSSKNKVTRTEIRRYYQQHNIDFPKNKDGNPNMSYSQNKETYQRLFKRKYNYLLDELDKSSFLKRARESDSISKITYDSENDDIQECIICLEPLKKDLVILECQHMYCVSCSLRHFKNKSNCPLCQKEIINKYDSNNLDNEVIINEYEITHIINQEIRNILDERDNQSLFDKISNFFKKFYYREDINLINFSRIEVENISKSIIDRIIDWYE